MKKADKKDAKRIYELIETIEEFNRVTNSIERIEHTLQTKTGRVFIWKMLMEKWLLLPKPPQKIHNQLWSLVLLREKDYRGKGFMHKCLIKLCIEVMSEGKTLCLFYDNPAAGRIYHKVGFETIEKWMMMTIGDK